MKKNYLFLLFSFFVSTIFSQSQKKITFSTTDAWTGNEIKNTRFRIFDQNEKLLMDSVIIGKVDYFFQDSKKNYYDLIINQDDWYYEERIVFNPGNYEKKEMDVLLIPNENYFAKIMHKEDSLFGKVTEIPDHTTNPTFKYPSFPGGENALNKFVSDHIIYPQKSVELGEQGKIFVFFVVELDGKISHIYVEPGKSKNLDLEARRIVNRMSKFIPATVNDKKTRSIVRLPISFVLP